MVAMKKRDIVALVMKVMKSERRWTSATVSTGSCALRVVPSSDAVPCLPERSPA